ncbi:O-acetylhomoserine aminocarboxypropyltransferase/cysteine synthase family protein [Oribacterium sinus]|uniref:O-acetylhomoserine aminocarboxypropyltransferase/cysteine synthase family protein n=1 Tax=Oribacterium sinus TaxID=237576 RepID=UPI0028D69E7E|nr:O-acetylhomoserine aminocarboxypropyltransferase/cysteine synthase family protein [Oribacterium sinus]
MGVKKRNERNFGFDTKAIHVGQEQADSATGARAVPIYQTTSYVFDNSDHAADRFALRNAGNIYGRLTNPTQGVLEARVAALEGGVAALAVASGAAAVTYAFKAVAHNGDHIVSAKNIYGGTYNFLKHTFPEFGVETTFVSPTDLAEAEKAIQENTKALYIESLGNPNGDAVDIEAWANLAHKHGLPLIVDNTFATPYLIRPIEYGADIVVHSATKFIGGHGSSLGGLVVDAGKFDWAKSKKYPWLTDPNPSYHGVRFAVDTAPAVIATYLRAITIRDEGAAISPFNAWVLIQGLESLALRVERHRDNALKVVEYLKKHPKVESVSHPAASADPAQQALYKKYLPNGGGSIFTFTVKGNERTAKDFIDNLELFSLLANVADVKSLAIHPASTTHSEGTKEELLAQGIQENSVRLSIGIENVEDIIEDLEEAFKAI